MDILFTKLEAMNVYNAGSMKVAILLVSGKGKDDLKSTVSYIEPLDFDSATLNRLSSRLIEEKISYKMLVAIAGREANKLRNTKFFKLNNKRHISRFCRRKDLEKKKSHRRQLMQR